MTNPFKKKESELDGLIAKQLIELQRDDLSEDQFQVAAAKLERLNKLKGQNKPERVSRDTLAVVAGNILGILIIVAYEQKHVMTSKSLGQLIRPTK